MRINSLHDALAYFPDIDGYWQNADFPRIEKHINSLLPANWATNWSPETVELLTQLSRAQALQGKLPEARAALDQAYQMLTESNMPGGARLNIRWLLEYGRILCLSMSPAKAHDFFVQAWEKAQAARDDYFSIDAALMLSTVRPPKFQNEWLKKALAIAEASESQTTRLWMAQLLFLDGWHAFDFRQFDAALESFNRAMSQPIEAGREQQRFAIQWSHARALRALGKTSEALAKQEDLLKQMEALNKVNGHVYLEIAECKQLLKHQEEAKTYFELAYGKLSADGWYSDNRMDELDRMKYLFKKR